MKFSLFSIRHHGATNGVPCACHELNPVRKDQSIGGGIGWGLFQGKDEGGGASDDDRSSDFTMGHIRALVVSMLGGCNDMLLVGYQTAGTPERDFLNHGPRGGWLELDGERFVGPGSNR